MEQVSDNANFEETRLLGGRVTCFQPIKGYRSAIDPILMQAAVPARTGETVLELGCGTGAASLCLAVRVPGLRICGLDIQEALIPWADKGAAALGDEADLRFFAGDLMDPPAALSDLAPFDHVMANPPYAKAGTVRPSPDPIKAAATVEGAALLRDWVRQAANAVKPGGTVTFIHSGDRSAELISALGSHLNRLTILPFLSKAGETAPVRVIVQGQAGPERKVQTLPAVVLHETGGNYGVQVDEVLRGGGQLPLWTE